MIIDDKTENYDFVCLCAGSDTDKIYKEVADWQKIKPEQLILHEGAGGGLLRVFEVFMSATEI